MLASIGVPLLTNSDAGVGFCLLKDAGAERTVDTKPRSRGLAFSKPLWRKTSVWMHEPDATREEGWCAHQA